MSGSFSLTEKLTVAAAFCAIVALGVGTEQDPGVIATSQAEPDTAVATVRGSAAPSTPGNYWSLSGKSAPPVTLGGGQARVRPPEILPRDFGATPSPDLPQ